MTFGSMAVGEPPEADAARPRLCNLTDLKVGARARIVKVGVNAQGADVESRALELRLLEMGFEEGGEIELAHIGLVGRDPLAFKVHGMLVALRRRQASTIIVESLGD